MCFNTRVEAPAPRNIAQETGETLQTQINLAPQQLAAYQQTAPGYAQTDLDILGRALFGNDFSGNLSDINRRLTDEAAAQSSSATTAQREADLADVQRLGGTVQNIQRGANSELFGNLSRLDTAAANAPKAGTPGQLDYAAYVRANPDLLANWQNNTSKNTNLTIEQYGQRHYEEAGQREGRMVPTSGGTPGTLGTAGTAYVNSTRALGQGSGSQPLTFGDYTPGTVSSERSALSGPSAIEAALERQALDELARGDQLSDDEARQVRVQSRAAADARGRGFSNAALADEVLNTATARTARANARRGFALTTNEALRAGQAADRSYGLASDTFRAGVDTTNAGLGLTAAQLNSGNRLAAASFNAGRTDADRLALAQAAAYEQQLGDTAFNRQLAATQARLATYTDPFQGVLGRASTNAGSNAQLFGNAAGTAGNSAAQTRSMFDPFNGYAADLYGTNYNAQAAANIATGNNRSALLGGLFSGLGSLGGAFLGG
jgi:hypothetical protein